MTPRALPPFVAVAVAVALLAPAAPAAAASLSVTKTADMNDGACDSDCSLREAVIAANSSPGPDTVVLPAGTYQLALGGRDEDGATGGDLDVTDSLTVTGASTADTIVDGGLIDRVFHIDPLAAGGIAASFSDLTIRNGAVGGSAGGGVAGLGDLTLRRVRVSSNRAQSSSAIDAGGTTLIESSTISGNGVSDWAIANYGVMTVRKSTVSGNAGFTGAGHGFFNIGALTIENSTISGNQGRGVSSSEEGSVWLDSSTIAANGGVAIASGGGSASVGNSILTSGVTNGDCLDPLRSQVVSRGHNLVNAGANGTCGFASGPDDVVNADPKLGALADNGGVTQTHALLAGSPALDSGDDLACPASDQRGVTRPQGPRCDIGAFEAEPAPPGNTPAGNPQLVFGDLTITFTGVVPPGGDTTVTRSSTGPPPPAGFEVLGAYYEIATTATFDRAELCFDYSGSPPSIVHFENGAPNVLGTTRDTGQQVCAEVTSFSPFALIVPSDSAPAQLVALIDKTLAYVDLPSLEAALRSRLEAAAAALVENKPAACRALAFYIAAVKATPTSLLSAAEKTDLVADATRIRAVIGCA